MKRESLLVFSHGGGRLGNQLMVFCQLLAWYYENEERGAGLLNMSFWRYSELFNFSRTNAICYFPSRNRKGKHLFQVLSKRPDLVKKYQHSIRASVIKLSDWNLLYHRVNVTKGNDLYLNGEEFLNLISDKKQILLSGFYVRCWDLVEKHQDRIRKYFQPLTEYQQAADAFMQPLKKQYELIIGIYLRQGDYKAFRDGIFYYPTERYVEWMKQVHQHFHGRNICFVVAGNEVRDQSMFADLPCHFATGNIGSNGHYMENIIELSQCDYILTVPSSFSIWAAFMGDVPIIPIVAEQGPINMSEVYQNHLFDVIDHPKFLIS